MRPITSPPRAVRRAVAAGFTLLEVLLTLAIIALLAGVLIGGSARLLDDRPVSAEEVFWTAVREARKTALKSERETRLRFDRDKKAFQIFDGTAPAALAADGFTREETPLRTFPVPEEAASDLVVDFLGPATKGGSAILVGGMLLESNPIKHVTFYADGTCTAFRVQMSRKGAVNTLRIDPWTCAQVLTPPDPNAG